MNTNQLNHCVRATALAALLFGGVSVQASSSVDKSILEPFSSRIGAVTPKIVGGAPSDQGQNRWITSLQYSGQHFCGGALVADTWVLTAAHCVTTESASDPNFTVWVGGYNLQQPGDGIRVDVAQIVSHPQYNDNTLVNDIALLRLSSPIPADVPRVTLATSEIMSGPAAPNQPVTVSGWGALSEGGGSPDVLHEVVVPVVSNSTCNAPQSYGGDVTADMICAGLRDGGKDSCQGDSGGPLWLNFSGTAYHVGVVSFGDGCARADKYGVYTRTASFRSWVLGHTGSDGGGGPGDGSGDGNGGGDMCPVDNGDGDNGSGTTPGDGGDTGGDSGSDGGDLITSSQIISGLSGSFDSEQHFRIQIPQGARRLVIYTYGGQGDLDLYVAHGRQPTQTDYDHSPYLESNEERVGIPFPQAGAWYVMLHAYDAFQNAKMRVTIE